MLFDDAAQGYLEYRSRRLAARTLQIDRERLVPLLKTFAGWPLETIGAQDLADYQRRRLVAGVSPRTVNMETGVLRRILKRAGLWGPLADFAEHLDESPRVARVLTPAEKDHLFTVARSNARWLHVCCAAVIASNATCRKVELRHVRRRDVDFETRVLTITRSKGRTGGRRTIPLNHAALEAFGELFRWGEKQGFSRPEDWVFPGRDRKTHRRVRERPVNSWSSAWRSLTRAAGLAGLRFHDLRHQCITELRERGVPDAVVMGLSGHKSSAMLDRYTHARLEAMREAVERLIPNPRPPAPVTVAPLTEVFEALARFLRENAGASPEVSERATNPPASEVSSK